MTSPFAALNWGTFGTKTAVYRVRIIQSMTDEGWDNEVFTDARIEEYYFSNLSDVFKMAALRFRVDCDYWIQDGEISLDDIASGYRKVSVGARNMISPYWVEQMKDPTSEHYSEDGPWERGVLLTQELFGNVTQFIKPNYDLIINPDDFQAALRDTLQFAVSEKLQLDEGYTEFRPNLPSNLESAIEQFNSQLLSEYATVVGLMESNEREISNYPNEMSSYLNRNLTYGVPFDLFRYPQKICDIKCYLNHEHGCVDFEGYEIEVHMLTFVG
jgi:hypothetical protein